MNYYYAFVVVVLFILMVVFSPFFTIMSINVLFGTTIAFTIYTWIACTWIGMLVIGWIRAGVSLAIQVNK